MPQNATGAIVPFDMLPGIGVAQGMASPSLFADYNGIQAEAAPATNPTASAPAKVSTVWYLFAVILIAVLLKFVVEHEKSGMEVGYVHIGFYDWIAVGLMTLIFLIVVKTLLNKYPVPGLTDLVNVA